MRKIVTALLLLSSLSVQAQQAVVNAVRLSSEAGNVRLVLDSNAEIQYKMFAIERSPRLVIDLKDTRLGGLLPRIAGADGMVTGIRAGVQNGKDLRLVVDLKQPLQPKGPPAARFERQLVLDLSSAGIQASSAGASTPAVAARTPVPAPAAAPRSPQLQPNLQTQTIAQTSAPAVAAPLAPALAAPQAPGAVEMPMQTLAPPGVRPTLATNISSVSRPAPALPQAPVQTKPAPSPAKAAPVSEPVAVAAKPAEKREAKKEAKPELKPEPQKEVAKVEPAVPERNGFLDDGVPSHRSSSAQPVQTASAAQPDGNIRVNYATVQPSHKEPKAAQGSQRDIVVVVDAGHGGHDVGAVGNNGTYEKDVALAVAKTLSVLLEREPGMRAVMTRSTDQFVTLRRRMEIARENHADLFVSVHADAFQDTRVSGASVYILSNKGASNEATRLLAQRENAAAHIGGIGLEDMDPNLKEVLMDLSQNVTIEQSHQVAERVLAHLEDVGRMRKTDVLRGGFVVLKSPDVPSILVETAYITNPAEERKLTDPSHQEEIARSILSGVREYFASRPPSGTLFAAKKADRIASR